MVQLSHPYMTNGKIIALTVAEFVSKVMALLLNMLSRLVITFLPRSKCLLISWLRSPSIVILEPKKMKSGTASVLSPSRRSAGCQILSPLTQDGQMWTQQSGSQSLCEGRVQAAFPLRWGSSRRELTLDASCRGSLLAPPDSAPCGP